MSLMLERFKAWLPWFGRRKDRKSFLLKSSTANALLKMEYFDGIQWIPVASESYVNAKTWDINTNTTSQLAVSRLNGYPSNASQYLRGDGLWVVPPELGGTVTSITAGTGLSGGTITTSGTISLADNPVLPGNASLTLPMGNSAQRPSFPVFGMIRGNSLTSRYEAYDGSAWQTINLTNATVSLVGISVSTGMTVASSPVVASGTIFVGLNAELQALSGLNTTGLVARTGSASYAPRTLTAGTGISITNGDGIAGNPTLSVSSIDINSATTGQLNISRLNGYPTSSSSFLRGDGTWNQINLSSNVTGSLPINKLAGYPGTTTTFLRGDGTWVAPSININSGTTGQLNISRLNGYPTNAGVYLNGNGTWTNPYLNNLSINGDLSLSGFDLTNVSTILCYTLSSPGTQITLGTNLVVGSQKIYGYSNGSYISHNNGTWFFTAGITESLYKSYGFLWSGGTVGTSSGYNFYSIVCDNRVAASEFNATSSQKIKRVSKEPMDIEDLRQKFLDISFKSYQYLDPSTGQGDHYGIIAEDLMEYFPQFVDAEHELYVPNCLKLMTLTKIEGLTYFFTHDFDLSAIDPKSQKIKIVMGDSQVDTTIVTLTKQTLQVVIKEQDAERVKAEHHKNHYFAYGTYEKCPTVSKNKLFEVGLILLQDVLRERKRK